MFAPKLYTVRKYPLSYVINHDYNIQEPQEVERQYYVKQGDNMLFRQVRMISADSSDFQKFVIFVDCTGGQNRKAAMKHLIEKGFKVGKYTYVASERSASMVRTSILSFVESHIEPELNKRITMEIEFGTTVISKAQAYRGLVLSTCHCLEDWYPKMIVVPDYFTTIKGQRIKYAYDKEIDFVDRNTGKERKWKQKDIAEDVRDIEINAFDGCGICHPSIMREFERRIGTSERMNSLILRGMYIKGMLHEVDYETFYAERGVTKIKDIWGEEYDVTPGSEPMIILTEGEYKGLKFFKHDGTINDWHHYWDMFKKYHHCLGVTKWNFTLEQEPLRTRVNYQILQDLDLPFEDFRHLADDSTIWYEKIVQGDPLYTYCFLGMLADSHEPLNHYVAAALRNPAMLKEASIKDYIRELLDKYKDEFKCGKLWMNATFKFLVPDLIALLEHIGGLPVKGCLESDEFYSFDRRGVMRGERLIERNPHICRSEHVILKATNNALIQKYCSHLQNVAMINIKSITAQRLNGADRLVVRGRRNASV